MSTRVHGNKLGIAANAFGFNRGTIDPFLFPAPTFPDLFSTFSEAFGTVEFDDRITVPVGTTTFTLKLKSFVETDGGASPVPVQSCDVIPYNHFDKGSVEAFLSGPFPGLHLTNLSCAGDQPFLMATTTFTTDVPVSIPISWQLVANAVISTAANGEQGQTIANGFDTAILYIDPDPQSGGHITAESGIDYRTPSDIAPVPEPTTVILFGSGLAAAVATRRRRHPNTYFEGICTLVQRLNWAPQHRR